MSPEPFLKYEQLAGLMGVSERTLKRWLRLGMPSYKWGGARRFLLSECVAWAQARGWSTIVADNHPAAADRLATIGSRHPKE